MDERLVRHALGFWQLKDKPDQATLQDYYAKRYYQTAHGNYRPHYPPEEVAWFHQKIARIATAIAAIRRGAQGNSLLDVGCGEGFAMEYFYQKGWSIQGLDFSRAGIENMHPHLLNHLKTGDLFELLQSTIQQGKRYDVLWLTNVLEHVINPVELLLQLRQLVAPQGVLAVTVPNDGSAWQEFLYTQGKIPQRFWIAIPDHLSYFDAASLCAVAKGTGWSCAQMMADFPIDWFLGNAASEYVSDRQKGPAAHQARIAVDTVLAEQPIENVNALYTALAAVGMGRQLTALLTTGI